MRWYRCIGCKTTMLGVRYCMECQRKITIMLDSGISPEKIATSANGLDEKTLKVVKRIDKARLKVNKRFERALKKAVGEK